MPFIVFQSFIGKRCELGRMGRVAGLGLRIGGREVRGLVQQHKFSDSGMLGDSGWGGRMREHWWRRDMRIKPFFDEFLLDPYEA